VLLQGLLAAASRKKTAYRTAALAALQKLLDALPPLTAAGGAAGSSACALQGDAVWQAVSGPMLEALQQHLTAASTPAAAAASAAGDSGSASAASGSAAGAASEDDVKPLPLAEACR
jgi:hypothetical protein